MIINRFFVKVEGIVQGVGFRPFVYNLALSLDLKGWVNNNSKGVFIDLEGTDENLNLFLKELNENPPPLSKVENLTYEICTPINYTNFSIRESEKFEDSITLISADMAICGDCLKDIKDSSNRRYRYPFTNCTNCGPRFSIIEDIPYDREKTTMKFFHMCDSCSDEYIDPTNRRFHAQPNACEDCGPKVWVLNSDGERIDAPDPIKWTADELSNGKIFAIKGLTGFHLVCDAKILMPLKN